MRIKALFVAMFGLSLAGGSVYLVNDRLSQNSSAQAQSAATTADLVVAYKTIDFGQPIESHMVTIQTWPLENIPDGAFSRVEDILASEDGLVRRAKGNFFEGEVILASKLSDPGGKVTIVQKLGENKRAMAIKVDAVTAVGGFVTPGDDVDVLMTQGGNNELRTVTILQNIRVIGVDQKSEDNAEAPEIARTVTVEVTPEQGQRLALAQKAGTLSLTLRTLDAVIDEPMQMIELGDLLQQDSPVENVAARPKIVVRRGTSVEEETIRR